MPRTVPQDLDADLAFVAADGYASMFEDAPAPTAEDLRDLQPSEPTKPIEMRKPERSAPEQRPPIVRRIASVA